MDMLLMIKMVTDLNGYIEWLLANLRRWHLHTHHRHWL